MPLRPEPTPEQRALLDQSLMVSYHPGGESAQSIAQRLSDESGSRITSRMVRYRAKNLGLRKRNSYTSHGPSGNAPAEQRSPANTNSLSNLSTMTAQRPSHMVSCASPFRPFNRRHQPQHSTKMVSLSREGRKLCGPTLSPLSSLSTSDSRLSVSPQRNDQDRDNPTKPLNTPSEDYSCVKSVREWYHYIQHNTQFYDNHSFAPMEFINEYFAFENLTQIGNWSESWPILRQTPTKPQIKSMLKDKNISLTLSFIFMQKLTGCFDLAADFRHRVAKVLKLILDFASDMYGHKHPLPLLLDEIFSQEGFPDESTDAHIFRIVFDSIRCSHHRAELRLVIATNLMWGDHLQSAETAFKGLVSAHTMPEENHIETIGGKVDMFIGSLARQNLAVVWMRQGKLEQSEELLREVLDRTKEFPLLHLSATSRLAKALYARRMHVQAESMLKDALTVARRLPKESQRVSFQADFESQLQNVRASHLSVTQDATIWHYYLSGIQSSRYEDSMCKWGSDQVCQDVAGI